MYHLCQQIIFMGYENKTEQLSFYSFKRAVIITMIESGGTFEPQLAPPQFPWYDSQSLGYWGWTLR